jgi:hypothetical protein
MSSQKMSTMFGGFAAEAVRFGSGAVRQPAKDTMHAIKMTKRFSDDLTRAAWQNRDGEDRILGSGRQD